MLLLGFTLASSPPTLEPQLIVYFLDVEQGNCILIVSPSGTAALIDAGTGLKGNARSDTSPVEFIRAKQARVAFQLRYVVATHYHADHIGKLDQVLLAEPRLVTDDYRLYSRGAGGRGQPLPQRHTPDSLRASEPTIGRPSPLRMSLTWAVESP
jgi:glyoxylase-like metal-dependent hydrolase (beta-lactamase superfamily II)